MIGGNTVYLMVAVIIIILPQWSPPLIGGNTGHRVETVARCKGRNGARR